MKKEECFWYGVLVGVMLGSFICLIAMIAMLGKAGQLKPHQPPHSLVVHLTNTD